MSIDMLSLFCIYIFSILSVVIFHEAIHWLFAKFFHRQPKLKFHYFITPIISYKNNHNDIQNLIISSSAPIILIVIGIFIDGDNSNLIVLKIMCFANILNLFPVTTDGEVILLSILNLFKKDYDGK